MPWMTKMVEAPDFKISLVNIHANTSIWGFTLRLFIDQWPSINSGTNPGGRNLTYVKCIDARSCSSLWATQLCCVRCVHVCWEIVIGIMTITAKSTLTCSPSSDSEILAWDDIRAELAITIFNLSRSRENWWCGHCSLIEILLQGWKFEFVWGARLPSL